MRRDRSIASRWVLGAASMAALATAVRGDAQSLLHAPEAADATAATTDRELAAASAEVDRLVAEQARLAAEEQGVGPRRTALATRARDEIRWLYHLEQGAALALQGGPESLLEHASRARHVREALRGTLRELGEADARAASVRVDEARANVLLSDATARRDALATHARELEALGGLRLDVTTAGLDGAPYVAAPTDDPTTVYGGGVGPAADDQGTFASAAGHLLFPVAGRAEVRRARREGAEGPGLEVTAPLGAAVRAVYPGRVAFADRYGPYGRIVILDHGEHYYTVSASLGSIAVHAGEEVSTGTVLGTVGDDGRGAMLYFEVRRGSDTIDPAPWLGVE